MSADIWSRLLPRWHTAGDDYRLVARGAARGRRLTAADHGAPARCPSCGTAGRLDGTPGHRAEFEDWIDFNDDDGDLGWQCHACGEK